MDYFDFKVDWNVQNEISFMSIQKCDRKWLFLFCYKEVYGMKSIYIFGIGKGKGYLERCLLENVYVCGYIDNYKAENMLFFEGKRVVRQNELFEQYDYIVITLMQYKDIKKALLEDGIAEEKIISFFDFEDASDDKNWLVIDPYKWRAELMWKHYNEIVIPTIDNMGYELYCDSQCVIKNNPKIINVKDTVDILYKEKNV